MAEVMAFRNNALPYPIYAAPWVVVFPLLDADGDPVTGATCDSEVSKNGDTGSDCTNEGTEITFTTATNKGMYYLILTAAEMTADIVVVTVYSATSKATTITLYPRKLVSISTGTAQGGAAGYITLASGTSNIPDYFSGCVVKATLDGADEWRMIDNFDESTQQAAVTPDFVTVPDADDTYDILLPEGKQINAADVKAWDGTKIPAVDTAGYPKVTIKDGTGAGEIALTAGVVDADLRAINGGVVSVGNLESQYDTTGLSGDTFPATQAQVGNLSSGSAAISTTASGVVVTTGNETNTYTATVELDLTYHIVEDDSPNTEFYYEFNVGVNGVPTTIQWEGYAQSQGDDYTIKAYNWGGTAWEQIGAISAVSGTTPILETFDLTNAHVGTGSDAGKVRFQVTSTDGTAFATDRILCSYAVVASSVGYAGGAIWVDDTAANTNTVDYVDGTADNPVSTWAAALTLSANVGINRFQIANGTTITLSDNSDGFCLVGDNWTLALGGQSIASAVFKGAHVTGTGTGAMPHFIDCILDFGAGGDFSIAPGMLFGCGLAGDLTLTTAGTYYFDSCYSGVAGTNTPSIDTGAAVANVNLNMRHYSGGIEIKNLGANGTDTMSLEGHGQLVLNANCDPSNSPVIAIRGHFTITDNVAGGFVAGGGTLSDAARFAEDQSLALVSTVTTNTDMVGTDNAALAATALSTATWTGARAGYLDELAAANIPADLDAVLADTNNLVTRITATLFTGITSLASWLGVIAGKTADAATLAEVNATTAGATYNNTTDSLESLADLGDTVQCWATAEYMPSPTNQLQFLAWLEINGRQVATGITTVEIEVEARDGTPKFTVNGGALDADGFSGGVRSNPTADLGSTRAQYRMIVSITYNGDVYKTNHPLRWLE